MEFLVEVETRLPQGLDDETRRALMADERRRGAELREAGTIVRIWRLPGRLANVGVWRAGDATELHTALTSLPLHEWQTIAVTPLAQHPLEAADGGGGA